ncbi:cytochrome b5 domain-containing protein [Olivibacter sitiensis]|uniref:cytochrome b5 domain-containing protein n=1 Tax=Olivibacter sitiensis TaxID=376470 RepID=UPI0004825362|nr:cytochrome b5 domain-containing protein [Olivibacter sitiensis]
MSLDELPRYTTAQLAKRNGIDRTEIWVAYKGIIYDVSSSRLWLDGMHYEHWAGQDLTAELIDAPHSANVFERFETIGLLTKPSY